MEGFLDARNRAFKLHVETIAGASDHGEAIGFCESEYGVIIFLAGAETLRELFHGHELPVGSAGRIVKLLQEVIQLWLMTQCQNDIEA